MVFWKKKVEAAADPPEVDEAAGGGKDSTPNAEANKGISKIDFIVRLVAAIATLGSAVAMATTNKSFSIFSQFINFKDEFQRLPTFTFFLVINFIACGYLVLSLVLSIFHIFKSAVKVTRLVLIIFDTVMLAFLTAGASAAAAIVHLAHKGNAQVNWLAICQQFNSFCERASGTLVGSFIAILALLLLIVLSAIALSRD